MEDEEHSNIVEKPIANAILENPDNIQLQPSIYIYRKRFQRIPNLHRLPEAPNVTTVHFSKNWLLSCKIMTNFAVVLQLPLKK